jgi:hypothetical protein
MYGINRRCPGSRGPCHTRVRRRWRPVLGRFFIGAVVRSRSKSKTLEAFCSAGIVVAPTCELGVSYAGQAPLSVRSVRQFEPLGPPWGQWRNRPSRQPVNCRPIMGLMPRSWWSAPLIPPAVVWGTSPQRVRLQTSEVLDTRKFPNLGPDHAPPSTPSSSHLPLWMATRNFNQRARR